MNQTVIYLLNAMFDRHCQCSHCMHLGIVHIKSTGTRRSQQRRRTEIWGKTILRVNKNRSDGFEVKQQLPSHFQLQRDMNTSSIVFK